MIRSRTEATGAAALGGLALLVRLARLDRAPYVDELNHVLSARSFLEDGSFVIGDGDPNTRAWMFTLAVASIGVSSYAVRMILAPDADWRFPILYRGEPQWERACPALLSTRAEVDVLHETHLRAGSERAPELTLFPKVIRAVFSDAAALARIVRCHASGLVVIEKNQWRQP